MAWGAPKVPYNLLQQHHSNLYGTLQENYSSGNLCPLMFPENLCPGVGHLSNLLEAVNVIRFAIFHLKICLFR